MVLINSLTYVQLLVILPIASLLLYAVLRGVYNLFWHPLTTFAGTRSSAITALPLLWHRLNGTSVSWIDKQHKGYGHIVRIAPNELSYTRFDAWRDIYGPVQGGHSRLLKDMDFYGPDNFAKRGEGAGLLRADHAEHAKQRRLASHAFSEKALTAQEPLLQGYADLLITQLTQFAKDGVRVDLVKWFNFTTFDIMADLTFGESLGLLTTGEYTAWVESLFGAGFKILLYGQVLRVNGLGRFMKHLLPQRLLQEQRTHAAHAQWKVNRRLATDTDRPDIWSFILRFYQDESLNRERGMSLAQMHSNASSFMSAGTETTATLLSVLIYLLCLRPDDMARVCKEIRSAFDDRNDMTLSRLARLEYTSACINEALRLHPSVPLGMPRKTPPGGIDICGQSVASGTTVSMSQYSAYHAESNFYRANEFLPARWLPTKEPSVFDADEQRVFQPFSYGPRNCLGRNLAMHEVRLVLANLLFTFDVELHRSTKEDWLNQDTFVVWQRPPLYVDLRLASNAS